MNEGWTTPKSFLENCLYGPLRVVTVDMLLDRPSFYYCKKCGRRSLAKYKGCPDADEYLLDYPTREKVYFVDEDMRIHLPPPMSSVWSRYFTRPPSHDGGSQQEQAQAQQEQAQEPLQTAPSPPPPEAPSSPPQPEAQGQVRLPA